MQSLSIVALLLVATGCGVSGGEDPDPDGLAPGVDAPRLRPMTCIAPPAQGDPAASTVQREGVERLNCHRNLMGLAPAFLDAQLSAAAQAHADYVAATGEYGHVQGQPDHPLFTGSDAASRALAAGVDLDPLNEALLEVVSYHSDGADPAVSVDAWIDSVYHRPPLVLPRLDGVGFGSADVFDVMEVVAPWEGNALEVAAYPGEDQRGVPTSFDTDVESPDPDPDRGVVGYPVTLSMLVEAAGSGGNPYSVAVDHAATRLEGPDGDVPALILEPASDDVLMRTVAILPHEPLAPGTTYTATMVLDLDGVPLEESWSFTTSR